MIEVSPNTLKERLEEILEAYKGDVEDHVFVQFKDARLTLSDLRLMYRILEIIK